MRLSGPQAIHAAAGHGRTSNSGSNGSSSGGSSGGSSSNGGNTGGSGGGFSAGGGNGGSGGGGAIGGGAGGGGMNPGGNGGRGNYGPSSPPTGSLPPFYESLKGGNNLANFANQYNGMQTLEIRQLYFKLINLFLGNFPKVSSAARVKNFLDTVTKKNKRKQN